MLDHGGRSGAPLGQIDPTTVLRHADVEREKRKIAAARVGAPFAALTRPKGADVLPIRMARN